jgi:hypothetical protein
MNIIWTDKEKDTLRTMRLAGVQVPAIAAAVGRKVPATYTQLRKMGVIVQPHDKWIEADEDRLRVLVAATPPMTDAAMGLALQRSIQSIRWKLADLGLTHKRDVAAILAASPAYAAAQQRRHAADAARLAAKADNTPPIADTPTLDEVSQRKAERAQARNAARLAARQARRDEAARLRRDAKTHRDADRARQIAKAKAARQAARAARQVETASLKAAAKAIASAARRQTAATAQAERVQARQQAKATARAAREAAAAAVRLRKAAERQAAETARRQAKAAELAERARQRAAFQAAAKAVSAPVVVLTRRAVKLDTTVPTVAPSKRRSGYGVFHRGSAKRWPTRAETLALSAAAEEAVAAFIAERGVTRPTLSPEDAAIQRLRQRGYVVLSEPTGYVIDGRHHVPPGPALIAFADQRARA